MTSQVSINLLVNLWLDPPPTVLDRLGLLNDALSDAAVTSVSPRFRVGAAHDVAVIAGLILAELDGRPLKTWHSVPALVYLREHASVRPGLSPHVRLLSRFDRDDYVRIWTSRDASRSFTSAMRIQSALRWVLPPRARALML